MPSEPFEVNSPRGHRTTHRSNVPKTSHAGGAYAVIRGDEPQVFVAEDAEVISRVLALEVVARTPASTFSSPARLSAARAALLEERWADALFIWMTETGVSVDVYPEAVRVWSRRELDTESAALEIRVAPIFDL